MKTKKAQWGGYPFMQLKYVLQTLRLEGVFV